MGSILGSAFLAYAPEIKAAAIAVGAIRQGQGYFSGGEFIDLFPPDLASLLPNANPADFWVGLQLLQMVFDHQDEYPSQWKAIESISAKLSINHETLRQWVRRAETDAGERPGLTTDERARMRELERENKELRRANEILKAASAFFGAELDRQSKK